MKYPNISQLNHGIYRWLLLQSQLDKENKAALEPCEPEIAARRQKTIALLTSRLAQLHENFSQSSLDHHLLTAAFAPTYEHFLASNDAPPPSQTDDPSILTAPRYNALTQDFSVFLCDLCRKPIGLHPALVPAPSHPLHDPSHDFVARFHCQECTDLDLCLACHTAPQDPERLAALHARSHPLLAASLPAHLHACTRELVAVPEAHRLLRRSVSFRRALRLAFSLYHHRPSLGFRCDPDGPAAPSRYQFVTYGMLQQLAAQIEIKTEQSSNEVAAVCGNASLGWIVCDIALLLAGVSVVPLNPNLDDETILQITQMMKITLFFVDSILLPRFQSIASSSSPTLKIHPIPQYSLPQLILDQLDLPPPPPLAQDPLPLSPSDSPDHVITTIFSSGSTGGIPKGVPFSNGLWLKLVTSRFNAEDPLIAFSLGAFSHMSDREELYYILLSGGRLGLSSAAHSADAFLGDFQALHPTYFSTTPRFFNLLHALFQAELAVAVAAIPKHPALSPVERAVAIDAAREALLARAKQWLGGRLKALGVGGAPISPQVKAFAQEAWGVEEGYGTTEAGTIADSEGNLESGVSFFLQDSGAYRKTDLPYPRGVFWVKTPEMSSGYLNNPGATQSAFSPEGYFCTGDIVELLGPRRVRIVDREKAIFKLAQGEFVRPEYIEGVIASSSGGMVDEALVTYGSSAAGLLEQRSVFLVVVPTPYGVAAGFDVEAAWQLLQRLVAERKLRPFEVPETRALIHLELSMSWTIENGCRTASNKKLRPALEKRYRPLVDRILMQYQNEYLSELVRGVLMPSTGEQSSAIPSDEQVKPMIGEKILDSLSAVQIISNLRHRFNLNAADCLQPVSYTHLTLPTN